MTARAPLFLASMALVLAAASVLLAVVLFGKVSGEGQGRRDQTCILFERQHEAEVLRLRSTYAYLIRLSPRERRSALNSTVAAQLPQVEQSVRTSAAPPYCDAPGVGLREPNPAVPERPPGL